MVGSEEEALSFAALPGRCLRQLPTAKKKKKERKQLELEGRQRTLCGVLRTFLGGFCGDAVVSPDPAVPSCWAAKGDVAAEDWWSFLYRKRLVLGEAGVAGRGESGPKSSARRRRE